jgi:hypothetical protein
MRGTGTVVSFKSFVQKGERGVGRREGKIGLRMTQNSFFVVSFNVMEDLKRRRMGKRFTKRLKTAVDKMTWVRALT